MIEGFDGSISGTTPFNTLDQLFTELNDGTIDNGVSSYGGNFAEIMNNSGMISQNAIVNQAGAIDDYTYGDSPNSLGISFTTNFNLDCDIIPCPTANVAFDNGVYFYNYNDSTTLYNDYINGDLVTVAQSTVNTKECCDEIGGYYLPSIISPTTPGLITPISLTPSIGNTEYFSVEELFNSNPLQSQQEDFVCWWCPPIKILCGQDYYNNVIGSTSGPNNTTPSPNFTLKQQNAGPGKGGGGPVIPGCIYQVGTEFIESDPSSPTGFYRYVINITDPSNPTTLCPSWYNSNWAPSGGGGQGVYSKGCCSAYREVCMTLMVVIPMELVVVQ